MSELDNQAPPTRFTAVRDGRVLRVTITNPKRKNAVDYDTMAALGDTFLAAGDDTSVRAIVLSGEGSDFCTGADLSMTAVEAQRGITPEMTMDCANRLVKAIVDAPVPVVARIRGAAAGVGVAMALAADLTYAADDAYLLLAFINIGLMPDGGAAAMVAASAGRAVAAEMALLGERLPVTEARKYGMLTGVVPAAELDARVEAALERLANGPRRALELTKRALNQAALGSLDAALAAEKSGQIELLQSPDFFEGAAAMLQKRKAVFA
ncbi:enoyl-CoA hydratase-related protein [Nocardia transvalensis]|uniref:enoyl-CoA hydratase-related protein n=1 Tax=Nocardia transvalensis TaxID=37333 RepID=UPI001894BF18|nr:enoyl-CoA hydratase-related protein [Nocardia transvalensis]MBF6327627.1 enoyl-CoA hydratase/isomerase family protein [Nocardia transvalensis]